MIDYLSNLREHVDGGVKDLFENPIKYTSSAVKDALKDFWDVGPIALSAFAFCDYGNEVLGNFRAQVISLGPLISFLGAGKDEERVYRNGFAGLASLAVFWGRTLDVSLAIKVGNYGVATFFATTSVLMERARERKQIVPRPDVLRI